MSTTSEISGGHFVGGSGSVYSVDHVTLATSGTTEQLEVPDSQYAESRSALQQAVTSYVSSKFPTDQAAGTVVAKEDKIMVHICAERPNLRNFWSGKWTSSWTITFSGRNACTITGDIKVIFLIAYLLLF